MSRTVTASAGTGQAIIVDIEGFRSDAKVGSNCSAESHACGAVAIFIVGVMCLARRKERMSPKHLRRAIIAVSGSSGGALLITTKVIGDSESLIRAGASLTVKRPIEMKCSRSCGV